MVREGNNVPFHYHEDSDIRHQRTRIRMMVLYLALVAVLVWLGTSQRQANIQRRDFEQQVVMTCEVSQQNTVNFNALIDTVIEQVSKRSGIPPRQKADAIKSYAQARQVVPRCPPRR